MIPSSRSTRDQRRAQASPRRMPVVMTSQTRVPQSSWSAKAFSTRRAASAGEGARSRGKREHVVRTGNRVDRGAARPSPRSQQEPLTQRDPFVGRVWSWLHRRLASGTQRRRPRLHRLAAGTRWPLPANPSGELSGMAGPRAPAGWADSRSPAQSRTAAPLREVGRGRAGADLAAGWVASRVATPQEVNARARTIAWQAASAAARAAADPARPPGDHGRPCGPSVFQRFPGFGHAPDDNAIRHPTPRIRRVRTTRGWKIVIHQDRKNRHQTEAGI